FLVGRLVARAHEVVADAFGVEPGLPGLACRHDQARTPQGDHIHPGDGFGQGHGLWQAHSLAFVALEDAGLFHGRSPFTCGAGYGAPWDMSTGYAINRGRRGHALAGRPRTGNSLSRPVAPLRCAPTG